MGSDKNFGRHIDECNRYFSFGDARPFSKRVAFPKCFLCCPYLQNLAAASSSAV